MYPVPADDEGSFGFWAFLPSCLSFPNSVPTLLASALSSPSLPAKRSFVLNIFSDPKKGISRLGPLRRGNIGQAIAGFGYTRTIATSQLF